MISYMNIKVSCIHIQYFSQKMCDFSAEDIVTQLIENGELYDVTSRLMGLTGKYIIRSVTETTDSDDLTSTEQMYSLKDKIQDFIEMIDTELESINRDYECPSPPNFMKISVFGKNLEIEFNYYSQCVRNYYRISKYLLIYNLPNKKLKMLLSTLETKYKNHLIAPPKQPTPDPMVRQLKILLKKMFKNTEEGNENEDENEYVWE